LTVPTQINGEDVTAGRASRALTFNEISTGLPSDGGYNYVAFGDFNSDDNIDIAFGGENYGGGINTVGLYAYTGDGGTSWTAASDGLPTGNSWGGLQLVDADEDGYVELYATDEHWGANNNAGLKVYEYRSDTWTDAVLQVSTPLPAGNPNNVIITDITGSERQDMVVCLKNGVKYYENNGGNPVDWKIQSTGLPTSEEFTAAAVADINGDGLKDIVAADYSGNENIYIQTAGGTLWSEHSDGLTAPGNTLGIAVGDVNNDTHMDIVLGTRDNGMKCWLGNSGGGSGGTDFVWTEADSNLPTSSGRYAQIQLVDIDRDGDMDLIAPVGTGNKGMEIYLGNGTTQPGAGMEWTLASGTNMISTGDWYGANVYDINGDGSQDIAAASWGSGVKAWLNSAEPVVVKDETPPAQITDLAVSETTTDSITLTWTAPGDDGDTGTAAEYDLRYNEKEINIVNWNEALIIKDLQAPKAAGITENLEITGLEQDTTYYFAMITADEVPNWSQISNSPSGTTLGVSKPAFDVEITPEKWTLDPGEDLDITIDVVSSDDGQPVSQAQVNVSSEDTDVGIVPKTSFTDNTGTTDVEITLPDVTTTTAVIIDIEVSKDGYKTNRQRITVNVNPPENLKYNLRVTAADITFSPAIIEEGVDVKISANIHNVGQLNATGFVVKFYVDNGQLGSEEQFTQLKMDGSIKVDKTWTASSGAHTIKVEIVPTDSSLDSDSTDNSAEKSIQVGVKDEGKDEESKDEGLPFDPMLLIAIIIIVAIIMIFFMTARKKGTTDEGQLEEERRESDERR
jgi:hypothetical protein